MKMENYKKQILVIEDNREFWETLAELFKSDPSYQFTFVEDGIRGSDLLHSKSFDLAIVDLDLPGKSGRDILVDAKRYGVKTPILILTVNEDQHSESDNIDDGALDYVTKTRRHFVIVSRIKAALRNSYASVDPMIPFGRYVFDTFGGSVTGPGLRTPFKLPGKPARILEKLMRSRSHVMSAQQLISEIWGYDGKVTERTLNRNANRINEIFAEHGLPRIVRYIGERECYELIRS